MGLALADDGRLPASLSSPPLIPIVPITVPAVQHDSHFRNQNPTLWRVRTCRGYLSMSISAGWSNWILHRKMMHLADFMVNMNKALTHRLHITSRVKFSWTTLYNALSISVSVSCLAVVGRRQILRPGQRRGQTCGGCGCDGPRSRCRLRRPSSCPWRGGARSRRSSWYPATREVVICSHTMLYIS